VRKVALVEKESQLVLEEEWNQIQTATDIKPGDRASVKMHDVVSQQTYKKYKEACYLSTRKQRDHHSSLKNAKVTKKCDKGFA
jgi:hypothetical protein